MVIHWPEPIFWVSTLISNQLFNIKDMNNNLKSIKVAILFCSMFLFSCEDILEEKVYSELTPGNFLSSTSGKTSVLNSAYGSVQFKGFPAFFLSPYTSGEAWNRGGSIEAVITPLSNFTWDSNHEWMGQSWSAMYSAIRDANIVIDNSQSGSEPDKKLLAEARFVRVLSYYFLYKWFGPTPLIISSTIADFNTPRASDAEMKAFVEKEFSDVIPELPATQAQYGRATKGGAMGLLCKFYLNTKQWQKCANIAKQILTLSNYELNPNYKNIFGLAYEGNKELLWVTPASPQAGHSLVALTFPTDYPLPYPNNQVFAARSYFFDSFVNSFEAGDVRRQMMVTEYTSTAGVKIKLLGVDQTLSYKFEFDPNGVGATQGNDLPEVRYSDILLSLAESLNELNGPTQEGIDLINRVRIRAGIKPILLTNFNKDALRKHILKERSWEFFAESQSREDQIRQGVFISSAIARGKNAKPFHVLFPIPLTEINANPKLVQNEGY